MQKTTSWFTAMMVAAVALGAIALLSAPAKADAAAPEATYKAKCAMCHGPDGKGKMPPYKTLTPDQVKDLVAFIRSFKKK